VLLIQRGRAPLEGRWTVPGGRVEAGERLPDALVREVREETGVLVRPGPLLLVVDPVERDPRGEVRYHFVILDYLCEWLEGEPQAGSDAAAARWVRRSELKGYDLPGATLEVVGLGFEQAR
jgi:ADP-ribose pyrophosphatase YjhB (NUDIX family)